MDKFLVKKTNSHKHKQETQPYQQERPATLRQARIKLDALVPSQSPSLPHSSPSRSLSSASDIQSVCALLESALAASPIDPAALDPVIRSLSSLSVCRSSLASSGLGLLAAKARKAIKAVDEERAKKIQIIIDKWKDAVKAEMQGQSLSASSSPFSFVDYSTERLRVKTYKTLYNLLAPSAMRFPRARLLDYRSSHRSILRSEVDPQALRAAAAVEEFLFMQYRAIYREAAKAADGRKEDQDRERARVSSLSADTLDDRSVLTPSSICRATLGAEYSQMARNVSLFIQQTVKIEESKTNTDTTDASARDSSSGPNANSHQIIGLDEAALLAKVEEFLQRTNTKLVS